MYARFQLSRSRVSARASRKTRSRTGRRSTRTWRGSRRPNLAMYLSSCFAAGGATSVRATNSHAPGNCARAYRSSAAGSAGSASPSIISSSSSCAVCAAAIARRTRCLCARHAAMYCSNVSIPSSGFILFTALRASAPAGSRCAWRASNHRSVPALHNKKASAARRVFRRLSPAPRIAGCICSTPCTRPPSPVRRLCSIRRGTARARMYRAPPGRRPVHWRTPPRRAGRCALFAQPRPRRLCAQVHRAPGLPCEINVTVYSPSLICTVNLRDTIPPHRILLLPRALPRQPDAAALGAHPVARQRARRVEDDHRLSPHHLQNSGVVANVRLRLKREDVPVQRRVHVRRVRRVDQVPLVRVPYARKRLERGGVAGERVRGAHRGRRLGPRHLLRRGRVDDARQRLTHPIGHVQLVSAAGHAPRDDEHGPLAGRAARVRHAEAAAGVVVDNAPQPLGERGRRGRRAPGKLGGQRQRPLGGVRRAHHVLRDPAAGGGGPPAVHLAWRAVHRRNRLRMGGTVIYFHRGCTGGGGGGAPARASSCSTTACRRRRRARRWPRGRAGPCTTTWTCAARRSSTRTTPARARACSRRSTPRSRWSRRTTCGATPTTASSASRRARTCCGRARRCAARRRPTSACSSCARWRTRPRPTSRRWARRGTRRRPPSTRPPRRTRCGSRARPPPRGGGGGGAAARGGGGGGGGRAGGGRVRASLRSRALCIPDALPWARGHAQACAGEVPPDVLATRTQLDE